MEELLPDKVPALVSPGGPRDGSLWVDLRAAQRLFDEAPAAGAGKVVGLVSSLLGETLLLDLVAHSLSARTGEKVTVWDGPVPTKDETAFGDCPVPSVRDLDAWLVSPSGKWWAVEAKNWTAASIDSRTYRGDPKKRFEELAGILQSDRWSGVNKIALPLRDDGYEFSRILAIWRPTSHDGLDPWSAVDTYTLAAGREQPIEVQVFSASLYVTRLLAERPDTPHLELRGDSVVARTRTVLGHLLSDGLRPPPVTQ